jgi:hypothetical protein
MFSLSGVEVTNTALNLENREARDDRTEEVKCTKVSLSRSRRHRIRWKRKEDERDKKGRESKK